jgi:hypothetical protein
MRTARTEYPDRPDRRQVNQEGRRKSLMSDLLFLGALIVAWVVLQMVVLPRLGVST